MKEWFSIAELVDLGLPDVPTTVRGVTVLAERNGWKSRRNAAGDPLARRSTGRGGGFEYHYSLLPGRAVSALVREETPEQADGKNNGRSTWQWFEGLPSAKKATARERLAVLQAVEQLVASGAPKNTAVTTISRQKKVGASTIYAWIKAVTGLRKEDWLPALAPKHAGRTKTAEMDEAAWAFIKADYLRKSRPSFASCYERLEIAAADNGWTIPSYRTLKRRLEREIPRAVMVSERQGADALKTLFPAQERDRTEFHALEAVNIDGHKWDVFVRWPDGTIGRPMMVAIQDLYSNKILGWRIDRSENTDVVRLAFHDVFKNYGIPDHCWLDNGRAFASKAISGGSTTRFRFKIRPEEPVGILTALGVEMHWTQPYSGQSKPIERAFRDLCDTIAKHPEFEGAYAGNKPDAKPENYGSKAVDLADFIRVVEAGIELHNRRSGRRTLVCGGVKSFDQAFAESYAVSAIRKAGPEQLRMLMLAAESIRADQKTGAVKIANNRYWTEKLIDHAGSLLTVRFDPDDLHSGVHVYRADGAYVAYAECIEAVGFADTTAAREHARKRRDFARATRTLARLENELTAEDIAAQLAGIDQAEAPAPETKVVRMFSGNTALAPSIANDARPEELDQDKYEQALGKALFRIHPGGRMD
jgi:transposase InsO family protein